MLNVTQRQRNGNLRDTKRCELTSEWHPQSAHWRLCLLMGVPRGAGSCTPRAWPESYEEPRVGAFYKIRTLQILDRRKITSKEGWRCRNEWPTTKTTKVTSVAEVWTKLLRAALSCLGCVAKAPRWGWFLDGGVWQTGGMRSALMHSVATVLGK